MHIRDKIIQEVDPDVIYLFGSYATGNIKPESDLDLLVLDHHPDKFGIDSIPYRISMALWPRDYHLDILSCTPEEFNDRVQKGLSFYSEIKNNGIKLYERKRDKRVA
jgi:predicted nucleotidyltransferase